MLSANAKKRNSPIVPGASAILVIDVQDYCCRRQRSGHTQVDGQPISYFFERVETVLFPNLQKLLSAARTAGCEVIYTTIESLTEDGRDSSLDYKLSNLYVPKGDSGAKVCEEVGPLGDEIVLPKTSCSVFNSTTIEYILRNLGVEQLMICGVMTNQCIESAVRDAADKGFLCTTVEDACACKSAAEHAAALHNLKGFSRIECCDNLIAELLSVANAEKPVLNGWKRESEAQELRRESEAEETLLEPPRLFGESSAFKLASRDQLAQFANKTLHLAILRPEDDRLYGQHIIPMFTELLDQAALELGFRVCLEDFLVKNNTSNYPEDYSKFHGVLIPGSLHASYDDLPWIHRLKEEIRILHRFRKPLLGVCFGHQVIAEALGGKAIKNPNGAQIAVQSFQPTAQARAVFQLPEEVTQLKFMHHNQDIVVKLPAIEDCVTWKEEQPSEEQFFSSLYSAGDHILSVQGHPEFATSAGRDCYRVILEEIDLKLGRLPNITSTDELEKWMQEDLYCEENLMQSKEFAKMMLSMIARKNCAQF